MIRIFYTVQCIEYYSMILVKYTKFKYVFSSSQSNVFFKYIFTFSFSFLLVLSKPNKIWGSPQLLTTLLFFFLLSKNNHMIWSCQHDIMVTLATLPFLTKPSSFCLYMGPAKSNALACAPPVAGQKPGFSNLPKDTWIDWLTEWGQGSNRWPSYGGWTLHF